MPAFYQYGNNTLVLYCHVRPRSSVNQVVGLHGDRLKIKLKAPPVDGAANEALVVFLADQFGVARSCIEIEKGEQGARKTVRITSLPEVPEMLLRLGGTGTDPVYRSG